MNIEDTIKSISLENEQWKYCPGFESKYMISSIGRLLGIGVYNTCKKGELIKQHKKNGRNSYMQVRLYDNNRAKTVEVHTLVAKAFIPNPNNLPMVNHINEDKTDNRVENLEWCDNQYNIRYSNAKSIDVYTKEGQYIESLEAIVDACAKYNCNSSDISRCCKSANGLCNGYQFRYKGQPFIPKPTRLHKPKPGRKREDYFKQVNEYSINGEFIKTWNNISEASKEYSIPTTNISKCCKGIIKTINGKIFLYSNSSIEERIQSLSTRKHKSKSEK